MTDMKQKIIFFLFLVKGVHSFSKGGILMQEELKVGDSIQAWLEKKRLEVY